MKLTPIRVRGKKARRPADDGGRATASPARSASASSPAPKRRRTSGRLASQRKPYVSFDQRLPLEVLEYIYLLSENVNLPLCSRRLHWMLTRRATRVELALAAFSPAWEHRWDSSHRQPPEFYRDMRPPGDPAFQTALLRCPWVDVPLLLDAEQLWQRRVLRDTCGGCKSGCAVEIILERQHSVSRRSYLSTAKLARALGVDRQEVKAIERAHAAHGCSRPARVSSWKRDLVADDVEEEEEEDDDEDDDDDDYDVPPTPPGRLASVHACFALDALNGTFNLSLWGTGMAKELFGTPWLRPYGGRHSCVHPETVIPERLLLGGGGVPAAAAVAKLDAAALDACQSRLQRSFELLMWLVDGCARLQPTDMWEVTVDGHQRLLALAAQAQRLQAAGSEAGVEAAVEPGVEAGAASNAGARARAEAGARSRFVLPLRPSVDALCTGMLGLYAELGVYSEQWPQAVLDEQLQRLAKPGTLDDAYRSTRAYHYMRHAGRAAQDEKERQRREKNRAERGF